MGDQPGRNLALAEEQLCGNRRDQGTLIAGTAHVCLRCTLALQVRSRDGLD